MSDEMLPIQRLDILRAACAMIERAETDKTFHEEQFKVLEFEPKTTMATLLEVALADGELSASEADVLRILAGRLKIDSGMFEQLLDQVRP